MTKVSLQDTAMDRFSGHRSNIPTDTNQSWLLKPFQHIDAERKEQEEARLKVRAAKAAAMIDDLVANYELPEGKLGDVAAILLEPILSDPEIRKDKDAAEFLQRSSTVHRALVGLSIHKNNPAVFTDVLKSLHTVLEAEGHSTQMRLWIQRTINHFDTLKDLSAPAPANG